MKMNIKYVVVLSVWLTANCSMGAVTLDRETILTDRALHFTEAFFNQLISIHGDCMDVVNDYIYVVWYEGGMTNRMLHLSRKPVGGTTWVDMNLGVSNTLYPASDVERAGMGDSHRTAAIGISPIDQTIHISFDQHGGSLRYLKSAPGAAIVPDAQWNTNLMNPERNYLVPGSNLTVTYPEFTRNDDGGLIFSYRIGGSARGDRHASYYNGSVWSASKLLVKGDSSVATNDFHFYSGLSYQHGKLYISGTVRAYSIGYNRGCYFGIFSSQDGLSSHFLRLDGNAFPTPLDTKAEMDNLLVASPSVAADDHVGVFGAAVTARGDVYLSNGDFTYLALADTTTFSQINTARGDLHGMGDKIFACSYNNGSVSVYRDKIHSAANGSSAWTEEYAGPQRGYLNSVSAVYKNKIIGLFLDDDGPEAGMKIAYCREYNTGEPIPQYPFRGKRQIIPGTVEGEYFDMGGQNISYYDATPARGGDPTFRPLEIVDCTSSYVGGIDAGEWMEYGVEVTNAGNYNISLKTSCVSNGRTARVSFDGSELAQFAIPNTTDLNVYQTVTVSNVHLSQGKFIMRLATDTGAFNLDSIKFEMAVLPPDGVAGTLLGDATDCEVQLTLGTPPYAITDLTSTNLLPGTSGGSPAPFKERVPVFPFRLPNFGAVTNPFLSASFTFNFISKNNTPAGNLDLYGLGRRADGIVLTNDYWTATNAVDPTDATLLQDNILTGASTAYGLQTSLAGGNAALRAYLNAQYAGGAGAGQYVFLRLSTDAPQTGGTTRYTLTSAEGGETGPPDTRPQINYTTSASNTAPVLATNSNQSLIAGQTLTFTNSATDADVPAQTLTFSLLSPPSGATINPSNGVFTWRPTMAQSPSTNPFSVKVADSGTPSLSATQNFSVTVLRPANPAVSAPGVSNGVMSFTITGDSGPDYLIQTSTNLTTWLSVWTNLSAVPPFPFTDSAAPNFNQRYYRVQLEP